MYYRMVMPNKNEIPILISRSSGIRQRTKGLNIPIRRGESLTRLLHYHHYIYDHLNPKTNYKAHTHIEVKKTTNQPPTISPRAIKYNKNLYISANGGKIVA